MCVSDDKVDIVVVVGIVCVRDPVIGLCVYACGKVEPYWDVDKLLEVQVFYDSDDVKVFTSGFL